MIESGIKYGLVGSRGRLGSEVSNLFKEKGYNLTYKVNSDGEEKTDVPQLLIDCSLPSAFEKTMEIVTQYNIPLIIATTGLSDNQLNKLKDISQQIPVVQSYNFSAGIQVLLKLTEMANSVLKDWDIEISETHHRFKKDKPSGTALMIKNILNKNDINISSLRLGGVVGDHTVSFGGQGETLSISHHAISRRTFAEGIYLASEFILKKKNGFYNFNQVIFGK